MNEFKILVVDDDEPIADAISLILRDEGFDVDTVLNSDEIYKCIDIYKPHLILLDVLMSGQDGRKICRQLKNQESTKKIPVIMMSAHPAAMKGSKECGAEEFLAKPFESEDLINLVKKYQTTNL